MQRAIEAGVKGLVLWDGLHNTTEGHKCVGVALAQTLQLLCPLGAVALSAWIFHERLTPAQLISAAILLMGAFLAMRTKPIATAETAENI